MRESTPRYRCGLRVDSPAAPLTKLLRFANGGDSVVAVGVWEAGQAAKRRDEGSMRQRCVIGLVWFAALSSAGCVRGGDGDGEGVVSPSDIVGSVHGTVTVEGTGLAGVTVDLLGVVSRSTTTGGDGTYSFSSAPVATYGVRISGAPADVIFPSTSTVATISTSGQAVSADFGGAYIRTSSIRGTVTSGTGAGIVATVTVTGVELRM